MNTLLKIKERPILFSGPMVRALLAGTKTQTRRIINPQPTEEEQFPGLFRFKGPLVDKIGPFGILAYCPYGQPGDRLWVRETHYAYGYWVLRDGEEKKEWHFVDLTLSAGYDYLYDKPTGYKKQGRSGAKRWWKRPSIFMPRAASRILIEVVSVRVERLQDISEADAVAEGFANKAEFLSFVLALNKLPKNANPWVWVVEFRRIQEGGEQL
jgi:hypothetical protein